MRVWLLVCCLPMLGVVGALRPAAAAGDRGDDDDAPFREGGGRLATPYDGSEIEEFMDLCNEFLDMCQECEQEWVQLEHEIIDSVENMSQRILYTEQLILYEADYINDMADRVVETEEICANLTKQCACDEDAGVLKSVPQVSMSEAAEDPLFLGATHVVRDGPGPFPFGPRDDDNDNEYDDQDWEKCAPMDEMIEVMNASIIAMGMINEAVVDLFSYLDHACNDLADDIVATECAIMNFSWQIGLMGDQIVRTEELMANATEVCCVHDGVGARESPFDLFAPPSPVSSPARFSVAAANYTPPEECASWNWTDPSNRAAGRIEQGPGVRAALAQLQATAHELTLHAPPRSPASSVTMPGDDGFMPCDTWWNPPCCAMEMCADMMAVCIIGVGVLAQNMTRAIEYCIDETLNMSDKIIETEGYIEDMGMAIHAMSNCIVETEILMLDFMADFCEHTPVLFGLDKESFNEDTWHKSAQQAENWEARRRRRLGDDGACYDDALLQSMRDARADNGALALAQSRPPQQATKEERLAVVHDLQRAVASVQSDYALVQAQFLDTKQAVLDAISSPPLLRGHEDRVSSMLWEDMLELMYECAKTMVDFVSDQAGVMRHMVDEIDQLAADITTTESYIVDMGGDILEMAENIYETEVLMFDLAESCMYDGDVNV